MVDDEGVIWFVLKCATSTTTCTGNHVVRVKVFIECRSALLIFLQQLRLFSVTDEGCAIQLDVPEVWGRTISILTVSHFFFTGNR